MAVEASYLLTQLAVTDTLRAAIGQRPGALELLLRVLSSGLAAARTHAGQALAALACNSEAVAREICAVDQALAALLGICEGGGGGEGGDALRSAAIKTLVNLADAFLESKELMCDQERALPAIVNMVRSGTAAAQGNACYLLGNLLELSLAVVERAVAVPGAVEALVEVLEHGSDFAMGNASRCLGNIVDENLRMAGLVAGDARAMACLVKIAGNGRDKSRGNACQTLGKLCEPHGAVDAADGAAIARHRDSHPADIYIDILYTLTYTLTYTH